MSTEEELHSQIRELQAQVASLLPRSDPQVMGVSVKLSEFWRDNPKIWFTQAEAQFDIAGITQDATKYGHVLSKLDARLADEVEDIIANPPASNKYDHLKTELIKRFSTTKKQRTRQLLGEEQLGDRKPSAFLRHLRSLAGSGGDEDIIRELWMRALPAEVQRILIAHLDLPLEKVAEIADNIVETLPPIMRTSPAVHEASASPSATPTPDLNKIMHCIEELTRKVNALSNDRVRTSRAKSRSLSRPRSRSASRAEGRVCWYHKRFATNATKCIRPCSWKSDPQGNGTSGQ